MQAIGSRYRGFKRWIWSIISFGLATSARGNCGLPHDAVSLALINSGISIAATRVDWVTGPLIGKLAAFVLGIVGVPRVLDRS